MRKLTVILTVLALLLSLNFTVIGAEKQLQIDDVPAQYGQTVYVPVVLNISVVGDTLGVTYSYDTEILEAIPGSSTWGQQGVLQDFNRENSGVWAASQTMDLKGTVCVLAFRVKSGVTFSETTVSCKVTVKNDTQNLGTYTAEGRIYISCDHNFEQWKNQNDILHSKTCTLCGVSQSQSHEWDEGLISDHPSDATLDLLTYTCMGCGATKSEEIADQGTVQIPTAPERETEVPDIPESVTIPVETQPAVRPPENQNDSGYQNNSGNQSGSGNQSNSGNQNYTGNNNSSDSMTDYNQGSSNTQNNNDGHVNSEENYSSSNGGDVVADHENDNAGHDHSHNEDLNGSGEAPVAVPAPGAPNTNTETQTNHDHDHSHQGSASASTGISLLALLAAVIMVAAAVGLVIVLRKRLDRK